MGIIPTIAPSLDAMGSDESTQIHPLIEVLNKTERSIEDLCRFGARTFVRRKLLGQRSEHYRLWLEAIKSTESFCWEDVVKAFSEETKGLGGLNARNRAIHRWLFEALADYERKYPKKT